MRNDSLTVLHHSRSASPSSSLSSSSSPSSSSVVLTWLAIIISTLSLPSMAQECQSHSECDFNEFCTAELRCALCLYCNDDAVTVAGAFDDDNWELGETVGTFNGAACPVHCRGCSSHEQCAIAAGNDPNAFYIRAGFFCAHYGGGGGGDGGAGDGESVGGGVNGTETRSVCQSCEELYYLDIYTYDDDSYDTGFGGDYIYNPSSSSCSNIPCLCAASSECPEDHYCASDLHQYAQDGSFIGPNGPRLDNDRMGPCRGYCVHCSLGCWDNLVVYYNQTNETVADGNGGGDGDDGIRQSTCQDVCSSTYVQCNTHTECQNHNLGFMDDDLYEDEASTRWCSANHECNECSYGCALTSITGATDFRDYSQIFPSIDGTCPAGCCGWGVSMNPNWHYASPYVVTPCGATPNSVVIGSYLVSFPDTRQPTIDEFLINGQRCSMAEIEYWEQAPSQSTNFTTATGEQVDRLRRKATIVDCSAVSYLTCLQYPAKVAVFMNQGSSIEAYQYIHAPITVRSGYNCKIQQTSSTPSIVVIIIVVVVMVVVVLAGCALSKTGACKKRDQPQGASNIVTIRTLDNNIPTLDINTNNQTNGPTSSSPALPTAIPVSLFGPTAPPPLPQANLSESGVAKTIQNPSRQERASPLLPDCESEDEA